MDDARKYYKCISVISAMWIPRERIPQGPHSTLLYRHILTVMFSIQVGKEKTLIVRKIFFKLFDSDLEYGKSRNMDNFGCTSPH